MYGRVDTVLYIPVLWGKTECGQGCVYTVFYYVLYGRKEKIRKENRKEGENVLAAKDELLS